MRKHLAHLVSISPSSPSNRTMFWRKKKKKIAAETLDPFYVSFIRRSQARLKCRERFTVKQVLGLIAAMILLLCINSVIVVTKSICHDTWGVVKLFNVYYKNNVLTCSLPLWRSCPCSLSLASLRFSTHSVCLTTWRWLIKIYTTATRLDLPTDFSVFYQLYVGVIQRLIINAIFAKRICYCINNIMWVWLRVI